MTSKVKKIAAVVFAVGMSVAAVVTYIVGFVINK